MRIFLLHILLTLAWLLLTGDASPANFGIGFLMSLLVIWFVYPRGDGRAYLKRIMGIPGFFLFFLWALFKANLRIALDIITPGNRMQPAIVGIPLDLESDLAITAFAMLLTLTPGTLSLDLSQDKRILYVHGMHVGDREEFIQQIKSGFEARVKRIFQ